MRRLVWFVLGVLTGGYVALRGREKAKDLAARTTPAHIGRTLGRALGERKVAMGETMADFWSALAEGAFQREDELRTRMLIPPDHPSTRP